MATLLSNTLKNGNIISVVEVEIHGGATSYCTRHAVRVVELCPGTTFNRINGRNVVKCYYEGIGFKTMGKRQKRLLQRIESAKEIMSEMIAA
ncbi:hypothetical protein [Gluconobacter kondonii]|uniref:hypothetical protein n=1 Tax=Gluconobacter kondonii TaxID=941463 RepID=UPI001B8BE851|nr:hypothetical protein [Gluconobacter kondonii]MBS1054750.1 hypothetical protein [Gluconobacter kondonii]